MGRVFTISAIVLLVFGSLACCIVPSLPTVDIRVPTIETGETEHKRETIELNGDGPVAVEVMFGAGELEIDAGASDVLFSGDFRYNVSQWEPKIKYEDRVLTIQQGDNDETLAITAGKVYNEWELEFTPQVPLAMELNIGAGRGALDLTGLQLERLEVNAGAGELSIHFDEPNRAVLETFVLKGGASRVEVSGIGNASPRLMSVQGGIGDITLDFTGKWADSAEIDMTAGVGSITLRLPDNVGVKVEAEGMSNINAPGFHLRNDRYYVNNAFGEAEIELLINITTGVGSINLREVSNN